MMPMFRRYFSSIDSANKIIGGKYKMICSTIRQILRYCPKRYLPSTLTQFFSSAGCYDAEAKSEIISEASE